jgi:uncharacterized membrane protein YdjX (TVP38/TMEM64 family)
MALGLLAALALALTGAVLAIGFPRLLEWAAASFATLQQAPPILYFGAMAIACLFPIPISAFYVAAGPLYGTLPSLGWIAIALAINMSISHAVAASWLRPVILRLVEARGLRIPELREGSDELLLIVLVRITPGLPYFAQNLLLGLADVERVRALVVSLPIQMVFATGFVLLGKSAFDERAGLAVTAIGLIGAASIAARFVHKKLQSRTVKSVDR